MQIDVPQLGVIDFPDEMSPQDVVSIIRTKLIPQHAVMTARMQMPGQVNAQASLPIPQGLPTFDTSTLQGRLQADRQTPVLGSQSGLANTLGDVLTSVVGGSHMAKVAPEPAPQNYMDATRAAGMGLLGMAAAPENLAFAGGLGMMNKVITNPLLKATAMTGAGVTMSAGPLGVLSPGSGATGPQRLAEIPGALPALIPAAIPVAKLGALTAGDILQTGYKGKGIVNPFADTLPYGATLRMGKPSKMPPMWSVNDPANAGRVLSPNAGSIFPSSSTGVPSTPTPIAGNSDQAATPSLPAVPGAIAPDFKAKLASVPDTQLMQRYQAALDASRALNGAGKHQEAMNLGTMAQFMREEMQNRRQAAVQNVVQPQQNIGVQNDIQGRLQSEAIGRTQPQVQENGQEGGQAAVQGQVQKAPQEQIPGYDAGAVRATGGSDVQQRGGEGVGASRVSIINKVKSGVQLSHDDLAFLYQMPFESSKDLMQQVNRNAATLLPESVPNRLGIQNAQRAWDARELAKQQQQQGLPQETVEQRNVRMLAESQQVQKAMQTKKMLANAPLVSAESQAISGVQKKQLAALGNDLGVKLPKGAKWTKLQDYEAADLIDQVRNVPDKDPLTVATKKALTERLQKIQAGDSFAKLGQKAEVNRTSRAERSRGETGALFPDSERGKNIDVDLPLPRTAAEVEQLKQTFAANKDAIIKVKAKLMFYDTPENKQELTDLETHQQKITTALSDALNKVTNTSKTALEKGKSIDVSSSVQPADKTGQQGSVLGIGEIAKSIKDQLEDIKKSWGFALRAGDFEHAKTLEKRYIALKAKAQQGQAGAVNPQGDAKERFGISAKANEERGLDVDPGEGHNPEELVHRGRELLASGVDPEKALKQALKNKNPLSDAISVTRAHGEALYKAASEAADKHGIDSPEYKAAALADSDWARKTQPLRTEAGEAMRAIQGTTDIDTGTFHGVQRAFTELMASKGQNTEMTPAQKEFAKKTTDEVKAADERIKQASMLIFKELHDAGEAAKTAPKATYNIRSKPSSQSGAIEHDLRDPVAKRAETLRVWNHVKANYLDKGAQDFDDVVNGTATDLGMTPDEVRRQLTASAKTKQLTDEMYMAMDAKRKAKQSIEFWLRDQLVPGWARAVRMVPRVFFLDKIAGHGTVGMITHAGLNVFDPAAWKTYFPSFLKQYKLAWSTVNHEAWVQDQVRKDNFAMWKRAGLKADPFKYPDDYQNASIKAFMGKLNLLIGNYGFDALKDFRINRANQIWNDEPASLKYKEDGSVNLRHAQMIANDVNHATGILSNPLPFGEALSYGAFAPTLEGSRWAWGVGDPLIAATYAEKWRNGTATPEEISFVKRQLGQKLRIIGTLASLLAVNQAINSYYDKNQKINYNNPSKSDFLAFKTAGKTVGIISSFLSEVRLLAKIYHAMNDPQKLTDNGKPRTDVPSRSDTAWKAIGDYARGKASPMTQFGFDVGFQQTATHDIVPWSKDQPTAYNKKETGGRYALETTLPIPFEEAAKAVWTSQGMDSGTQAQWLTILKNIAGVAVPAGLTGVRIQPDYSLEPQTGKQNSPPAFKPPTLGKGFKKYSENDIIQKNGKNYTVVGFDHDGQPMVEEV